jgi:peptidoglycan hydrolase FlgJ
MPVLPPSLPPQAASATGLGAGLRVPGQGLPLGLAGQDPQALQALRSQATRDPKAAVEQAAKQFEALFMQELVKSMRQATPTSGLFENSGTQMGTEMLDSQYALKLTGLPGGLSQAIARQLMRAMDPATTGKEGDASGLEAAMPIGPRLPSLKPGTQPASAVAAPMVVDALKISDEQAASTARRSPQALQFTQTHGPAARAVERESGIPAAFMIGQAAHETGWGRKEILHADGRTSHNLFGIKAGGSWKGPVAEITTTEYIDGAPRKVTAKFRAYASYEESFRDYARLMRGSERYAGVMQDLATNGATVKEFATGLQRAGYATDPAYAQKLGRVINTTLQLQRALG